MARLLSTHEIEDCASRLRDWTIEGNKLRYTRKFQDFVEAIAFVNQLVQPSESLGHHPDIEISYNQVNLLLWTHDAGGLTELDFVLADAISQLS